MFHIFFLVKYSKALEEGTFRGRSADFLWMLLLGALQCIQSMLLVLCSLGPAAPGLDRAAGWVIVCL